MANDSSPVSHLPPETVSRIKSSQVITSVYAAVKELVENALDSTTSVLNVRLEDYGLKLIEVRDNGHGISESDLSKVCLPHTTSKITQFSDLERLSTYGFRGEALSALCQLASVSITSKTCGCSVGRSCCFSATGTVTSSKKVACNVGTCVVVSKLFHPLPVRLKFHSEAKRKKEQLKKIEELLMAYSVCRPGLHVTLTHDRQVVYHKSAAADVRQCLHAVFKDCAPSLAGVCRTKDQLTISVFLPRPSKAGQDLTHTSQEATAKNKKKTPTLPPYCRGAPDRLFILVNDRPVYHKELEKRVKLFFSSCHENFEGRWPAGVVMLTLPADAIDVNLEPNKDRVVISSEDVVLELLTEILKELYGPVSERLPKSLHGKQTPEENKDQENINKEIVNITLDKSYPTNSLATFSNLSNHRLGSNSIGQVSESSNCKNISTETNVFKNASDNKASNLTSDERNVLEEILSRDVMSQEPTAFTGSFSPTKQTPGFNISNTCTLNEPDTHSKETEETHSSGKRPFDEAIEEDPVLRISSSSEASDDNSRRSESPPTLLRGVSDDIDPVAWSRGQVLGDAGTNIQSVQVMRANPRGCSAINDGCAESPAKRLKISHDDWTISSQPVNSTPAKSQEPLNGRRGITSTSENIAPEGTIKLLEGVAEEHDSSSTSSFQPSTPIAADTSIGQSVTRKVNSTLKFGESSDSILIRNPLRNGSNLPAFNSPKMNISRPSSDTSVSKDNSVLQSNTSEDLERTPQRPEISASRAACRTVMGTSATERLPHGGHLVSKPMTAFAAFAKHIRSDVLRELAGADFSTVGREIAARWKALDAEGRRQFEQLAERDVERYNRQIREHRQRQCVAGRTGSPLSTMDRFVSPVSRRTMNGRSNDELNGQNSSDVQGANGSVTSGKGTASTTTNGARKGDKVNLKPWQNRCLAADVSISSIRSSLLARSKKSPASAVFKMVGRLRYPLVTSGEEDSTRTNDNEPRPSSLCGDNEIAFRNSQPSHSQNNTVTNSNATKSNDPHRINNTDSQMSGINSGTFSNGIEAPVRKQDTLCWVCVDNKVKVVYGIRSSAVCELVMCYRLLESYSLPAQPLLDPVPFNESTLVHWHALLQLERQAKGNYDLVTDQRLASNGLEVVLYKDGPKVTHGELVAAANNVGFYGINDLHEVLSYIARNPSASLIQTRPVKLRHWMQAESVRLLRSSPEAADHEDIEEKLHQWRQFSLKYSPTAATWPSGESISSCERPNPNIPSFLGSARPQGTQSKRDAPLPVSGLPNPELCLHNKPILHVIYDLDELPGSQSQRSQCSQ